MIGPQRSKSACCIFASSTLDVPVGFMPKVSMRDLISCFWIASTMVSLSRVIVSGGVCPGA
jgi:hypothetical protein